MEREETLSMVWSLDRTKHLPICRIKENSIAVDVHPVAFYRMIVNHTNLKKKDLVDRLYLRARVLLSVKS